MTKNHLHQLFTPFVKFTPFKAVFQYMWSLVSLPFLDCFLEDNGSKIYYVLLEWVGGRASPEVFVNGKHIDGSDGSFVVFLRNYFKNPFS